MKKEYKAHPLMILHFMKPFLFVLIFPFIRGVIRYLTNRKLTGVIIFEIVLFIGILAVAILKFRAFRIIIDGDFIKIKTGFIFVKKAAVRKSMISSIELRQNPLDTVFHAVTYSINTEAGRKNTPDFKFKLSEKDSGEISKIIFGEKETRRIKYSIIKIAVLAATTSSAFMGIVIGVPIINKLGDLFGMGVSKILFNKINDVTQEISKYFPPIINTLSLIFLLGYGVSFIYSLIKNINFQLNINDERLEVGSGFFVRKRIVFKRKAINSIKIEQSPLMHIFKRYAMKVSVGGYGDFKSESEVIVPAESLDNIREDFKEYFPFLISKGKEIVPLKSNTNKRRFLVLPSVLLLLVLGVSFLLGFYFEEFGKLIFFLSCLGLIAVFYYAYISLWIYSFGKIQFGETFFTNGLNKLSIRGIYCPKEKIGEIKITQFFTDFREKTCRIKVVVRSESADKIKLKLLDFEEVKKAIKFSYRIDV